MNEWLTTLSWLTQGKRQHSYNDKILRESSLGIRTINFSFERQKKLIFQLQALQFFPLGPKRPPTSPTERGILGLLTVCTRTGAACSLLPVVESCSGAQPGPCADMLSMAAFSNQGRGQQLGQRPHSPGRLNVYYLVLYRSFWPLVYLNMNGESLQL